MAEAAYTESLASAAAAKEAGTAALQAGQLKSAAFHYKKVYLYLAEYLPQSCAGGGHGSSSGGEGSGVPEFLLSSARAKGARKKTLSEEQAAAARRLFSQAQNNLALVDFKLGRYREGAAAATQALEQHDPQDAAFAARALLRRANCLAAAGDRAEAEADLQRVEQTLAAAGLPADSGIAALRSEMAAAQKAEKEKEKNMWKGMF